MQTWNETNKEIRCKIISQIGKNKKTKNNGGIIYLYFTTPLET
jgi:hypothetical protein